MLRSSKGPAYSASEASLPAFRGVLGRFLCVHERAAGCRTRMRCRLHARRPGRDRDGGEAPRATRSVDTRGLPNNPRWRAKGRRASRRRAEACPERGQAPAGASEARPGGEPGREGGGERAKRTIPTTRTPPPTFAGLSMTLSVLYNASFYRRSISRNASLPLVVPSLSTLRTHLRRRTKFENFSNFKFRFSEIQISISRSSVAVLTTQPRRACGNF